MTKIFTFLSLVVSIAACVLSGAFFVYSLNRNTPMFPAVLLIVTTFPMFIICTLNHYHTVMSPSDDNTADEDVNNENEQSV